MLPYQCRNSHHQDQTVVRNWNTCTGKTAPVFWHVPLLTRSTYVRCIPKIMQSCQNIHVWTSTLALSILGNVAIIAVPQASIHNANVSIYKQVLLMGSHCWHNGPIWIDDTIKSTNQTHITLCSPYYVHWHLNVIEWIGYFDGLVQDCSNSIANTPESCTLQSCTKPSICRDIHLVYRKNYAHGFVVLCFLLVTLRISVDIYELLTHILSCYFTVI